VRWSKATQEIKFIVQVLLLIQIEVEMPVIVHVNIVGAICMAVNVNMSLRAKHVGICYHFVRDIYKRGGDFWESRGGFQA